MIQLLDHGYIKLVHVWGSDQEVIEDARMSTDKGFLGWGYRPCDACDGGRHGTSPACVCKGTGEVQGDEKLLRYLYTEKPMHSTPFEGSGAKFEIKAPIMVYREWHRHRTQSYNEQSARYSPLPNDNYVPTVDRLMRNSKSNKQAGVIKGADELTDTTAIDFQERLTKMYKDQEALYQWGLQAGVPKELARLHIGVGRYSRMRASANLLNWIRFLTLRMHQKAQEEIRVYASAAFKLLSEHFPRTMALFDEGRPR